MYWASNGKIKYKLPNLPFSNFHLSSNTVRYGMERLFCYYCLYLFYNFNIEFVQMICDLYEDKELRGSQSQKNDNDFGLCIMLVIYTFSFIGLSVCWYFFLNWF